MLDRDRLALYGMMDSISKIETYLQSVRNVEDFEKDIKTSDACLMNVVNIGEMVTRLSDEFISKHEDIEWFRIKGLRNIIAHDYFGIDLRELYSILTIHLPKLKAYIVNFI
jgi:uncharacterized protein with HEPN domain